MCKSVLHIDHNTYIPLSYSYALNAVWRSGRALWAPPARSRHSSSGKRISEHLTPPKLHLVTSNIRLLLWDPRPMPPSSLPRIAGSAGSVVMPLHQIIKSSTNRCFSMPLSKVARNLPSLLYRFLGICHVTSIFIRRQLTTTKLSSEASGFLTADKHKTDDSAL